MVPENIHPQLEKYFLTLLNGISGFQYSSCIHFVKDNRGSLSAHLLVMKVGRLCCKLAGRKITVGSFTGTIPSLFDPLMFLES